jgi:Domain of unknown function (DUF4430)
MSVQMTISINGQVDRTFSKIAWHHGMNVQQAMEIAYGSEQGYDFALQYFGPDLGYEVVMIDNISQQAGTDAFLFWQLSINDTISTTGIDETKLSDGDDVEWNYTTYTSESHDQTRYKGLREAVRKK